MATHNLIERLNKIKGLTPHQHEDLTNDVQDYLFMCDERAAIVSPVPVYGGGLEEGDHLLPNDEIEAEIEKIVPVLEKIRKLQSEYAHHISKLQQAVNKAAEERKRKYPAMVDAVETYIKVYAKEKNPNSKRLKELGAAVRTLAAEIKSD